MLPCRLALSVWSGDFLSMIIGLFSSPIRRPVALYSGLVQSGAFPAGRALQGSDPPRHASKADLAIGRTLAFPPYSQVA